MKDSAKREDAGARRSTEGAGARAHPRRRGRALTFFAAAATLWLACACGVPETEEPEAGGPAPAAGEADGTAGVAGGARSGPPADAMQEGAASPPGGAATVDAGEESVAARLQELQDIWHAAADSEVDAAWALVHLEAAAADPQPRIAALAARALADLERLWGQEQEETVGTGEKAETAAGAGPAAPEAASSSGAAADPTVARAEGPPLEETLTQQALYEPDGELRALAVQELALYRSPTVAETLSWAAADPDPAVRYGALQALWFSAADGVGTRDDALDQLEAALRDEEPGIAELAGQALDDLRGEGATDLPPEPERP